MCMKKNKLWVKWIHTYYGNRDLLLDIPNQATWIIQRILKATKSFSQVVYGAKDILTMPNFLIQQIYLMLREQFQKVSWRKLLCINGGLPRWTFIVRLAALGRLNTRDRIVQCGVTTNSIYSLCEKEPECLNYLFFV
ncbi:hypothetical protein RDI58_024137 [Solanum bulbocastanum]|uniref:Reverse transcriptase zinc-binding domain-containing protein n=1 Tax=Solanum bulbocastanum TaxID=147425 RepID=A0AAN8SZF8_SOLBU